MGGIRNAPGLISFISMQFSAKILLGNGFYHEDNISVTVACSQMKGSVVSHVCSIYSCASLDQHVHNIRSSFSACPM